MDISEVQLLCGCSAFCGEVETALAARGVNIDEHAKCLVLVDSPIGWSLEVLLEADINQIIFATDNPCPEYTLDVLEMWKPVALAPALPFDKLTSVIALVLRGKRSCPNPYTPLSPVERETLKFMAMGTSNKAIADSRNVSIGRVKNTASMIYLKLHLRSRLDISHYYFGRWYLLENWTPPLHALAGPQSRDLRLGS